MFISKDIQLEKALEAMIEQYAHEKGEETAKGCPIIQGMMESLEMIKASNNVEVLDLKQGDHLLFYLKKGSNENMIGSHNVDLPTRALYPATGASYHFFDEFMALRSIRTHQSLVCILIEGFR